jgi:hypothetical protein
MPPYFSPDDVPAPFCEGSFLQLTWEGAWDDPARPQEIVCPTCGLTLIPECEEYGSEEKKGLFFISMPTHYPGETPS